MKEPRSILNKQTITLQKYLKKVQIIHITGVVNILVKLDLIYLTE